MAKVTQKIKSFFTTNLLIDICIIAIIVISTLFPTLFDPEHASWKNVCSNFIFSVIIMLLAFISQLNSGKLTAMKTDKYKEAKELHINKIHEIQKDSLSKMQDLYVKDFNKNALLEYAREVFQQFEIDFKLFDCDYELIKVAVRNNKITKDQYSVIKLCRSGKVHYNKFDLADLTSTQILKKTYNSNKSQQTNIIVANLLSKVSWMLAGAIIIGTFVPDAMNGSGVSSQSWINLISRIFTFIGGIYCGGATGKEIIEDEIRLYDLYYNFNSKFMQDFKLGIWKPKNEDVQEDIVEQLKKLQQQEEIASKQPENEQIEEQVQVLELTEEQAKALTKGS